MVRCGTEQALLETSGGTTRFSKTEAVWIQITNLLDWISGKVLVFSFDFGEKYGVLQNAVTHSFCGVAGHLICQFFVSVQL